MCNRERQFDLRKQVAAWQVGAVALLVIIVALSAALSGLIARYQKDTATWERKYMAAAAIERDAVEAYGSLILEVEEDEEARREAARAFEQAGEYRYIGECTITHYCCEKYEHICGTGDGLTASGVPVAPGMVAVDTDVIPMGSTVIIDGTSYLATDRGVTGKHIDIAVATHEEAERLGVYAAEVWILPAGQENGDG